MLTRNQKRAALLALNGVIHAARQHPEMTRPAEIRKLWADLYGEALSLWANIDQVFAPDTANADAPELSAEATYTSNEAMIAALTRLRNQYCDAAGFPRVPT